MNALSLKTCIAGLLILLTVSLVAAQQVPENRNTFGLWEISSEQGFSGTLMIERGICQFSLKSSMMATNVFCTASWNASQGVLTILARSTVNTHTVPVYEPDRNTAAVTTSSTGTPFVSFMINKFGRKFMKGHVVGAGDHVPIKLTRH